MFCICMDSEHSPSLGVLSSSSSPFTSFSISPTCIYVQGVGQTQEMGSTQRGWGWGEHRGGGDGVNTEGQVQRGVGSTQRGWG